jgi:hypothetical protein
MPFKFPRELSRMPVTKYYCSFFDRMTVLQQINPPTLALVRKPFMRALRQLTAKISFDRFHRDLQGSCEVFNGAICLLRQLLPIQNAM